MNGSLDVPAPPLLRADLLKQAVEFVRARRPFSPRLGVILNSGIDPFSGQLQTEQIISTNELPGYSSTTVGGRTGRGIFGTLGGKNLLVVQGCAYAYEGCPISQIGFMIHLMAELGISRLLVMNTASGLNPHFAPGDLMLIEDHINLMSSNPLRGQHRKEWGERWPDMHAPYDPALQKLALQIALNLRIPLRRGVLLGVRGPSHETAAEVQMAKRFGADAITVSTVPEVIVAISRRMQVLGLSYITNPATGLRLQKFDHAEVPLTAPRMIAALTQLLIGIIKRIG